MVCTRLTLLRSVSPGQLATKGVPEICGYSVCCMLQLNWLMYAKTIETGHAQACASLFSYVYNWLAVSGVLQEVHTTLSVAHEFAAQAGYVVASSKTWVGSTSPKGRKLIRDWSFQGSPVSCVVHKLQLGMLFRFSRSMSVQDVVPRWEQGLARVDRLVHKNWHMSRKISTIRRVVFPQLLSSCESVHVSLSSPPPLSLRYRTMGVLSGSALATIRGDDVSKCELCGSDQSGQQFLVLHCPATAHLRSRPDQAPLLCLHPFTRCTGIPGSQPKWPMYSSPESVVPGRRFLRMDQLLLPTFPESGSRDGQWRAPQMMDFWKFAADSHPGGSIHNIARAETMAIVRELQSFTNLDIFCDNSGVVGNLSHILAHGFHLVDWRTQPNSDLWIQIATLIISRRPGSVGIFKVKSHRTLPAEAPEDERWKTCGNDFVDLCAKAAVKKYLDCKIPGFRDWIQTEASQVDLAIRCTSVLHEISNFVFHARKSKAPDNVSLPPREESHENTELVFRTHFVPTQVDYLGSQVPSGLTL